MRRLIIGAVAAAALLPGSALAADWSRPILLEPTPPGFDTSETSVRVAGNAKGDAIAVWVRGRDSDQGITCCDDYRVVASYRRPGGSFGKPETISRLGTEATAPAVAMDPAGNAFVAWTVDDLDANLEIAPGGVGVAIRRAGARNFGPSRLVSRSPGDEVVVTAGATGEAVVAWQRTARLYAHDLLWPRQIMAAVQVGPTRFARPVPVSAPTSVNDLGTGAHLPLEMHLAAAADRSGTTYLAWARADGSNGQCCRALEASRRRAGGRFEPPSETSEQVPAEPDESRPDPFVASGPAGGLIAWMRGDDLIARDWPAGEPLRPPSETPLPSGADLSALGVAADGSATALISATPASDDPNSFTLAAARRPFGGSFGPLQRFGAGGPDAALLVEPAGGAHALWARYTKLSCYRNDCTPDAPHIDAADAPGGGAFGSSRTIGPHDNGSDPSIAGVRGGAVAGWLGDHGPWVSALGPRIGASPMARPLRGPRVTRFAKRGPRTFTFRLSRPAHVLIDVVVADSDGEPLRRVGQMTVTATRGPSRLTLPRRIALVRGRRYAASLIAQDAAGHDSRSLAPLIFRG